MNNQPLVSVSIAIYNGLRWLEGCFTSLCAQTYPNLEIIAFDNNSNDGSAAWLKKFSQEHPNVIVHFNETNLGFAKTHNLGIAEAKGQFVCLMNQDIILDPDFITQAVKTFTNPTLDSQVGALQGKLLRLGQNFEKTNILDSTGLKMLYNRRIISRGQGETDTGQYDQRVEIFGADGALPMYKKDALEAIKVPIAEGIFEYFDEDFFMYKEDVDLAWRFILFGWQTVYVPKARAWHARGAGESAAKNWRAIISERRKIPAWSKLYAWKNQRLMQIKNELPSLLLKNAPAVIWKEFLSLCYLLVFEPRNIKAILLFLKQVPNAFRKRAYIMQHKKVTAAQIAFWFKN